MSRLRLAVAAKPALADRAFAELRAGVRLSCRIRLDAVYVPNHAALFHAIDVEPSWAAWVPSLVARDLWRSAGATPLVVAARRGATTYYSALTIGPGSTIRDLADLRGTRIGWVSKLSATGYVVPRLYLQSLGLDLDGLFAAETFHGTHKRLSGALVSGEADVIATHAVFDPAKRTFVLPERAVGARLLATAGPIPGDVVVAGREVPLEVREAFRRGLLALRPLPNGHLRRLMAVDRFEEATAEHFEPLARWSQRAVETGLRPLAIVIPGGG